MEAAQRARRLVPPGVTIRKAAFPDPHDQATGLPLAVP
jgi:hypothetical protein